MKHGQSFLAFDLGAKFHALRITCFPLGSYKLWVNG